MGGVQLQYTKAGKVLGVALQGTAFLQLMAGLTQAPGSLSGDVTFQVQGRSTGHSDIRQDQRRAAGWG